MRIICFSLWQENRHACTVFKEFISRQNRLRLCSAGKHGRITVKLSTFSTSLLMTAWSWISFSLHLKRFIYHLLLPGLRYVTLSLKNKPLLMRQAMSLEGLEWFFGFDKTRGRKDAKQQRANTFTSTCKKKLSVQLAQEEMKTTLQKFN